MKMFVILTVQKVHHGRQMEVSTVAHEITVKPDTTRGYLFTWARDQLPAHMREGFTVLFFSAEPQEITVTSAAPAA